MSSQRRKSATGSAHSATEHPRPPTSEKRSSQAGLTRTVSQEPEKSAVYSSRTSSISSRNASVCLAPAKSSLSEGSRKDAREASPPPTYEDVLQAKLNESSGRARGRGAAVGRRPAAGHPSDIASKQRGDSGARSSRDRVSTSGAPNPRNTTRRPPLWKSGSSSSSCGSVLGIGVTEMVEDALDLVVDGHTSTQRYRRRRNPDSCAVM